MFKIFLLVSQIFTCEAHYSRRMYDISIFFEQATIPPYTTNIYFNEDPMTVKEIKAIIRRNEGMAARLDQIQIYRNGQKMEDNEILGISDHGSRNLTVKVPY